MKSQKQKQEQCDHCKTWGPTITREQNLSAIACGKCGRLTWPNLGVNCPAGMAWSISGGNALILLDLLERQGKRHETL